MDIGRYLEGGKKKAGGSHTNTGDECVLMEVRSGSNDAGVVQSVIGICGKRNEKVRCYVSQVDKWETKEGDTHMSVHDQFRHR